MLFIVRSKRRINSIMDPELTKESLERTFRLLSGRLDLVLTELLNQMGYASVAKNI
jgi:hypothetical protein